MLFIYCRYCNIVVIVTSFGQDYREHLDSHNTYLAAAIICRGGRRTKKSP